MLSHTGTISIELSNTCQLRAVHDKCPLHLDDGNPDVFISSDYVFAVIQALKKNQWPGMLRFHVYNEPLTDPRIQDFIKYAHMNNIKTEITTNGLALDQDMLDALVRAGLTCIRISVYDHERTLDFKIPHVYYRGGLDDRMSVYDRPYTTGGVCHAPLSDLTIFRTGDVGLCCVDWRRDHTFGSLSTESLEEILTSEKIRKVYNELSTGIHSLDICKRCKGGR